MFFKKKKDNSNSLIFAKNTFYDIENLSNNKKTTISGKVEYIKKFSRTNNFLIFSNNETKIKNNIFVPNILKGLTNYIIVDENDFIYKKTAAKMKEAGYEIITFDLKNNFFSHYINPFDIKDKGNSFMAYLIEVCSNLLSEFKYKYSDPFWHASEKNLLAFALFYISLHSNNYSVESIKYTLENMDDLMIGETNETLILLYSTCKLHASTFKSCYIELAIFLENYKDIFKYFQDDVILKKYLNKKTIFYINFVDSINIKFANTFIKYIHLILNENKDNMPITFMYNNKEIHDEVRRINMFSSTKIISLFNCKDDFEVDEIDDYNLIIDILTSSLSEYLTKYYTKDKIKTLVLTKMPNELVFLIKNPDLIMKKDKINDFTYEDIDFIAKEYNILSRKVLSDKAINYLYFKRIEKDKNYNIYFFKRNKTSKIEVISVLEKDDKLLIIKENKYDTYDEMIHYNKEYELEIEEMKYL